MTRVHPARCRVGSLGGSPVDVVFIGLVLAALPFYGLQLILDLG